MLLPLLLLVGTFLQTMKGRQDRLHTEIQEEQALQAAEAGLDVALHEARQGSLTAGHLASYAFQGTLPGGSSYDAVTTWLGDDDLDNDGDLAVDEPDEAVFEVVSTGVYGEARRRVATYLQYVQYLPGLQGAVTLTSASTAIGIDGTPYVTGMNHRLDTTLAGADDVVGITMAAPGTLADLTAALSSGDTSHILGATGTPSIGASGFIAVDTIVDYARYAADTVIVNESVKNVDFGTMAQPTLAFRQGELKISGNVQGYGLLVVDGDVRISGTFRWDGVIVCTGEFTAGTGTADVYGAVLIGPTSPGIRLAGTLDVHYSTDGVALAAAVMGRYVLRSWHEVGVND